MIEPKDVVIGVLGAAAALGGLVLVFLGIIIAAYQSYPGGVPTSVVTPYRVGGGALFAAFALSLVTVATCVAWLVTGGPSGLYGWTIGLFGLQLIAVLLSAGWTTRMVLSQ
jgi:hypothetical protein